MKDNRKQTTLEVARYGGARVPLYQPHMSVISESPRVKDPEAVRAKLDETNCIEKEIYGQPVTSRSSLATHLHACQTRNGRGGGQPSVLAAGPPTALIASIA